MQYDDLIMLKENLELLAQEKDPKTGYAVQDTVLRSSFNKKILLDAAEVIDQLLKLDFNPSKIDRRKKYAFFLKDEEKSKIDISKEPISISAFTYIINEQVDSRKMKKIKAVQITAWLTKKGFLEEIEHSDGRKFKIPTQKAKEIGIISVSQTSESGRVYGVNMYDENAQKYIIDHLDEISKESIEML